jgi:3-isopropylmalate/(R)-2-methylmalate dehydratase small subunit
MKIIKGRVWKFGDNVDTDVISPTLYLEAPMDELKKHVLEAIHPRFAREARPGDMMVAGKNFGCGSSRENAPDAIRALGIGAVMAESFARIFFRNAVAIGLPVLPCPGVAASFREGDEAEVDIARAVVKNLTRAVELSAFPLPKEILEILDMGGTLALLKKLKESKK